MKYQLLCYIFIDYVSAFSGKRGGYVPDGLTQKQWDDIKKRENKPKNYGKSGISKGFRSRSLNEFLTMRENGNAEYNFPVFFAKERVEKGEIKETDIPYMQRKNGKPDGSDLNFLSRLKNFFSS